MQTSNIIEVDVILGYKLWKNIRDGCMFVKLNCIKPSSSYSVSILCKLQWPHYTTRCWYSTRFLLLALILLQFNPQETLYINCCSLKYHFFVFNSQFFYKKYSIFCVKFKIKKESDHMLLPAHPLHHL